MRKKTLGEKKKKINRRNSYQYASLEPKYNLKSRQEEIKDIASYANKLPPKAKAWLAKFVEEEVNASFGKNPINKTKVEQRLIYNRNNARNRDIYTLAKASGNLIYNGDYTRTTEEDGSDD